MSKIYGIDLGTTNSVLGLGDQLLTGLVPSVVDLRTGNAGNDVLEEMSAARSFKCDISLSKEGQLSVSASSRVLRQLVKESGENVERVVISVPAYFSDNQRQATIKAAQLAGLDVVGLINEPTAAAIYASKSRQALSLVFDLGGGTFDVSVVDSRFGDYDVQATDGCILGGDNFDANIRRWVIKEAGIKVHHLNQEDLVRLKWECSKLKIRVQQSRHAEELDLTTYGAGRILLSPDTYKEIMKLTFAETIIKAKKVLGEAVPVGERFDLVMVGGSTRCPFLREWVAEEMGQDPVPLFYDPDKIVAQGAALYAQMIYGGTAQVRVSDVTKALSIEMSDGSARVLVQRNSKIPVQETTIVYNSVASDKIQLNLYQGDRLLASQNELIGSLTYNYGSVIPAGEGEVIVEITIEVDGTIRFSCKELLKAPVEVVLDRTKTSI